MAQVPGTPGWINILTGPDIYSGSIEIGRRPNLQFRSGFIVTADPLNSQNIIDIEGGGGIAYVTGSGGTTVSGAGLLDNPYVVSSSMTPGLPNASAAGETLVSTGTGPGDWIWLPPIPVIDSFTGFTAVQEVGDPFINPTLAATQTAVAVTSETVSWTNPSGGPVAFSSPQMITATFDDDTIGDTSTVTLTITNAAGSATATQTIYWAAQTWSGIGGAGATGLNGSTGALVGAAGTLSSALQTAREQDFSVSPSVQKVYFACPVAYGAATFKDAITGFVFAMNAPSTIYVTNAFSVVDSYYLYESTNLLNAPFTVAVS